MKCPIDNADLVMAERHSIEIDYCPKCRGVWLDRGELDKIIERAAAASPQPPFQPQPEAAPRSHHDQRGFDQHHRPDYNRDHQPYDPRYKKRKSSFLGELFDFGD